MSGNSELPELLSDSLRLRDHEIELPADQMINKPGFPTVPRRKGPFAIHAADAGIPAAETRDGDCEINAENKRWPVGVVKEGSHRRERLANASCLEAMNFNQRRNERTEAASFAQQDQPNGNSGFGQMITKSN